MFLPRLSRLFAPDGYCLDVAVDHGLFDEPSLVKGIEDLPKAVRILAEARPDAIQLTPGGAELLQSLPSPRPALVLRLDVANVYGPAPPPELFSELIDHPVEEAVRLDAACVVVNLLQAPGRPALHRDCLRNIVRVRADCTRWGMPLMVEPLVLAPDPERGGYAVNGDPTAITALVRQAAELGADVIKCDPTDPLEAYGGVVTAAGGRPVLPRGGGRVPVREVLRRTAVLIAQGAKGAVYGRNILQHPDPGAMVAALMAVIHRRLTPDQAEGLGEEAAS